MQVGISGYLQEIFRFKHVPLIVVDVDLDEMLNYGHKLLGVCLSEVQSLQQQQ